MQLQKTAHIAWACCLFGCSASISHHPVASDNIETGIRYYRNAPYLLVYSNGRGGLKWQILYLPDQLAKMAAQPKVVGGHSELTMYFQNGVLSNTIETGDTTAVPKALIAAVQSALPLISKTLAAESPAFPGPYLYKIVVEGGTLKFYGGQAKATIQVPALSQGK
ncbi:hypothetical protein [Paraburkholderia sp. BR14262]